MRTRIAGVLFPDALRAPGRLTSLEGNTSGFLHCEGSRFFGIRQSNWSYGTHMAIDASMGICVL